MLFKATHVFAGDLGITYVKTLGQSSPDLPLVNGGGRLAVDEKGDIFAGTPGLDSYFQKISADGRVVWRDNNVHSAYYGTAVDAKYVYSCGLGYYNFGHLQRRKKASGAVSPGWDFIWQKPTDVIRGVRGFAYPGPLLVDGIYLYILDIGSGELRRLDKETAEEKPFASPVKVEGALDMALSKSGSILLLVNSKTEVPPEGGPSPKPAYVEEIDKASGRILRGKMISGLRKCAALAVHPLTGEVFIGEGGEAADPVNKIRIFAPGGTDTGKTIGRGGEWQGKWSADAFAFSGGLADICFDAEGGFWSNTFSHRINHLALLVHFSPDYKPDSIVMGARGASVWGTGIAVDQDLNVALGGNYMLSWDGNLLWTSGLLSTGKLNKFPTTIDGWEQRPVYSDARQTIAINVNEPAVFALDSGTGESTGKRFALPDTVLSSSAFVGNRIYILGWHKVFSTTSDLLAPKEHFVIPEAVAAGHPNGLAVSDDERTLYISSGADDAARVYAYRDGTPLWSTKAGAVLTRYKGFLLASNSSGPGILVLDASDGSVCGIVADSAVGDRLPLGYVSGATVGSRGDADYLFVGSQYRVLVYRIASAD